MIELFDPARLSTRRDNALRLAAVLLVGGVVVIGGRYGYMQHQWRQAQDQSTALTAALQQLKAQAQPAPAQALVDELTQTAQRLEAEVLALGGPAGGLKASQWMERLSALTQADVGLVRVELDRQGQALVEGQARDPQAVAHYVQAWERHAASSPLRSRALEVREEPKAGVLRFQLRATVPGVAAATAASAPASGAAAAAALAGLLPAPAPAERSETPK